jgi:hypothetical protein
MKKFISTTCIAAMLATQSFALVIEEPPTPPTPEPPTREEPSSSGGIDPFAVVAVIGALILIPHLLNNEPPAQDSSRPDVDPEFCIDKYGNQTTDCRH